MLKVLVTGASGLLGRTFCIEGEKNGFQIIGLAFSRVSENLTKCDLTNPKEIEDIIDEVKPDFIVHAAAERFPDRIENDIVGAQNLNITTSKNISLLAKKRNCRLIYISTDYVFDGTSPPYSVDDVPNPLNKYGITKYQGEKESINVNPDVCVLRIPVLYGDVERLDESAVTCLLKPILSRERQKISHYEKRYPSHTRDISRILCDLIKAIQRDASLHGIFHWCGKETMTKYDMVLTIAKNFGLPIDHIEPDKEPSSGATRPYNAQLDSSRLKSLNIDHHTPVSEGLHEVLSKWIP